MKLWQFTRQDYERLIKANFNESMLRIMLEMNDDNPMKKQLKELIENFEIEAITLKERRR